MEFNQKLNNQLKLLYKNLNKSIRILETIAVIDMIGGSTNLNPIIKEKCSDIFSKFKKPNISLSDFIKILKDNKELQEILKIPELKPGENWQNSENLKKSQEVFSKINNIQYSDKKPNLSNFNEDVFNDYCDNQLINYDDELFNAINSDDLIKEVSDSPLESNLESLNNLESAKEYVEESRTLARSTQEFIKTVNRKISPNSIITNIDCSPGKSIEECANDILNKIKNLALLNNTIKNLDSELDTHFENENKFIQACQENNVLEINRLKRILNNLENTYDCKDYIN